jgi:peptidoglycan-associated lipoprotein
MLKRQIRVASAVAFSLSLIVFAGGCKKKGPAPPPAVKATPPPPQPTPPPPAKPVIASFTAEPSSIEAGQSSTLRWSTQNATSATIGQGVGTVPVNGSRQVFPTQTTTYELSVSGPGGSDNRTATVTVVAKSIPPPPPPTVTKTLGDEVSELLSDALFDFDKSDIREDARAVLTRDSDALKGIFSRHSGGTVVVEGHCDERGSAEYNLGLGDRRSTAAKEFLQQLGVSADRLKTVTYGKERPQCTESTEDCWQKNRRAHFSAQ